MSFQPLVFPLPARLAMGAWLGAMKLGIGRISLVAESLIEAACKRTGRPFEEELREPLERLARSLEEECALHPIGRFTIRDTLVRTLENRLRLETFVEKHPEIAKIEVKDPIFVVGMQRTGTTMLHRLLTCDARLRHLPAWEGLNPVPLREPLDAAERRTRMAVARTAMRALRYLGPELSAIHPMEVDGPEEDVHLLDLSFLSPTADAVARVPSYSQWFESTDQLPAYRTMRRAVQVMLWQRDGRYLGKSPHHLEYLDELLTVFPDAKVIQTHRNPLRTVASFCSMMGHGRAMLCERVDGLEIGRRFGAKAVRAIERTMASRSRLPEERFLDVHYRDTLADPMAQVRRIYEFLELELTPEVEAAMETWRAENSQTKHGTHRYQLEDFGLEREELEPHFKAYMERFDIPSEDAA